MKRPFLAALLFLLLVVVLPTSPLDLVIIPFLIASLGFGGYVLLVAALLLVCSAIK